MYYSSATPYYKRTTLYYKVLLRPKRRQNDVLRTTKYYSVLQSTTSTGTTSERRPSSTTPYYKVLLQYYFVLQSTTLYYKVLLQYYSVLQTYYKVLVQYYSVLLRTTMYYSSTTPYYKRTTLYYKVLLRPKRRQNDVHPVLLRTTKYHSSTTPHYKRTTKYYSSCTPYYKRTKKYYSSTTEYYSSTTPYYKVVQKLPKRAFRARLPQLFKEQDSKTSISCEASSTFQGTRFQNEHFVRGVLNFSRNKLPKRAFRARLPQLFKQQASKRSIWCEASSTFQSTKLPKRAFRARLPQLCKHGASKVLRLPRQTKMTSHLESLKRQNEHFVRDFLQIPHFQLENRRFRASFSYKVIFTELKKYDFCEASASFHDTHQMLRLPRYLQGCHVRASLPLRFAQTAPSPHHQMLRLPRHRERPPHKVLRLPRKTTRLHWHTAKVLRLSRKTRKWSHILWLGSAKTSISCETSSTFHTLKVRIGSQCECTAQWQRINDATTTTRRRDDDEQRRDDDETAKQREHRSNPRPQL